MFEVGKLVVKTAGRDANKKAVIINVIDETHVMIDGETRRRKCNIAHLEPLETVIKIAKDASHDEVKKAFEKIGLSVKDSKPKQKVEKPKKIRKSKKTEVKTAEEIKKEPKKAKADKKEAKEKEDKK